MLRSAFLPYRIPKGETLDTLASFSVKHIVAVSRPRKGQQTQTPAKEEDRRGLTSFRNCSREALQGQCYGSLLDYL